MLRFLDSLYTTGIVVFFVLFLVFVPSIPLGQAVVAALVWPYGVYKYFVDGSSLA
jgi:hypothetical protein